jgi:hypothetical protein
MSLKIGDTIRFITGASGFRNSAMYTHIPVKSNSYAVITDDFPAFASREFQIQTGFYHAAILRYVKSRDSWKPTKVIVAIRIETSVFDHTQGEGRRWARTNLLEKMTLIDMEVS